METLFSEGGLGLLALRWLHFMAGVTWIGLLYYFNFVQGSFFSEIDAQTKNVSVQKLVPRALWWFRWGAMFTFLSGAIILGSRGHHSPDVFSTTSWGINISIGALLGTLMFLNVWLIIWPNQKVIIASANSVIGGGKPLPEAGACGAKSGVASRTNVLFSIPMLLFMGSASHYSYSPDANNLCTLWIVVIILIGLLEFNAIKGKNGPMTTIKGVITCGFVLTAVLFGLVKFLVAH